MYPILRGFRVVECASFIAAPSCTLHMQQLGAEVIRIDPIEGGPDYRRWPVSPKGDSFYWEGLNKGKKSVAIDLSRPQGRELATQLICAPGQPGGILVTNFPQNGFLSHDKLARHREDLITVRVTGWSDGSPAVDYTVNAAVGLPYMTGSEANGAEPVNHVLPAWDLMTGAYAAFVVLAAELHRRETGQGREIRLPLADVALASLGHMGQIAEALFVGDRPRTGNALFGAFGRDFVCADGERIMLVAITPRQWRGLVAALAIQAEVAELECRLGVSFDEDEGLRYTHRTALYPLVERAVSSRRKAEWAALLDPQGVCWGGYYTLGQALQQEPRLFASRDLFGLIDQVSGYRYPSPGAAAEFLGMPREFVCRAPHLGEHTDAILSEVLSLSSAQIGALHDAGVVRDAGAKA